EGLWREISTPGVVTRSEERCKAAENRQQPELLAANAGRMARAAPVERFLQPFLERDDRRVAKQLLRLADVRLRVADVPGPGFLIDRLQLRPHDLIQGPQQRV